MIGATTSQTLDLTLINKGDIVYGTSTIKVEIGLKIGSTVEYIPIGIYNIDDIEKTDYTIKITAFDNMMKFERNFSTTLGDTLTLQQVVSELNRITGVEFTGNLPAYTVKKLEGFSCREVLGYVASLCGGNAVITREGKFTIVTPKDINYSIGTSNYFIGDYKREETKYKIGKISCQAGEEVLSKGSIGADSMELEFENPWVTTTILNYIYTKLNGFEYLGYSMKWQGDLSLDVGDIVTITDKKGVVRKHPILSRKFSYTGGLTSEISAKGENKNKNEFSGSGPSTKKIERVFTELAIVNKALIGVAYIDDLTAGNIKFDTASGNVMDLQTLLVKFVSGENGQYLNLTSNNVVIATGVIKDAMIESVNAGKIKAGTIDTNLVRISSTDGSIAIANNTMQFKDKSNKVRIQMGQDTQGNFNFILRGEDGTTTLIDHTGIKEKAIADNLIKEKMIAENAVGEKQINYSSLVTGLNKDTNTSLIKASKVAIDLTGQSLEVAFNSLKSNVDSKESRNLARGTQESKTKDNFYGGVNKSLVLYKLYTIGAKVGDYITVSFDLEYTNLVPVQGQAYGFVLQGVGDVTSWDLGSFNGGSFTSSIIFNVTETKKVKIIKKVLMTENHLKNSHWSMSIRTDYIQSGTMTVTNFKGELGENPNPVWSIAPEDIDSKIEVNTTAISVAQGKIEGIIKDTSITQGEVTILKDNYLSIKGTVDGISTTVGKHTTSISNLGTDVSNAQKTANNANSLADSKAKVFTSTPTTPYKVGDIWTSGPSGDIMRCKTARASGNYVASDWEKASKYTDDTTANAVSTRVTVAESSIKQLNNQIALKVEQTDINQAVNSINTDNLIIDNSFENNGYGWSGTVEIESGTGVDGGKCLRLNATTSTRSFVVNKLIDVLPGQKYKVGVWYKTSSDNNGTEGNQKVRLGAESGALLYALALLPGANEWTYKEGIVTIPSDVYKIKFTVSTDTRVGYILVDNISFKNVELESNVSSIDSRLKTAEIAITKDAIISTVQATINTAKSEAINSANSSTDNKLKSYSTTTAMNSAITQSANGVKTEVSNTYLSKGDAVATYATKSSMELTANQLKVDFSSSGLINYINNSGFQFGEEGYTFNNTLSHSVSDSSYFASKKANRLKTGVRWNGVNFNATNLVVGRKYTFQTKLIMLETTPTGEIIIFTKPPSSSVYTTIQTCSRSISGPNIVEVMHTFTATEDTQIFSFQQSTAVQTEFTFSDNACYEGEMKRPWIQNNNEIINGNTTIDTTGITIYNGALTIKNKANANVLTGDSNGNLTITGTFVNKNWNGVDAVKIQDTNIILYDWERNARQLGMIFSSYNSAYPNVRGLTIGHSKLGYTTIGYENSSGSYTQYISFDKYAINPNYTSPIRVLESTVFEGAVNMQDRVYIPGTMYFGDSAATTTSRIWGAPNSNRLAIQVSVSNKDDGFMIQSNTGSVLAQILAGYNYPIVLNNNTQIKGNLDITGSKARLVNTDSFGGVRLNAVESASPVFEDIGEGTTDNNGVCYLYMDPVMLETINTKCNYQVFLQKYGEGDLFVLERNEDCFIVKGTPNIKFGWRFVAKQRGYELERLEQEKIIIPEEFYSNIDDFEEVKYNELADEYLKNYEMELMNID